MAGDELATEFLEAMRLAGRKPETLRAYRRCLDYFAAWLTQRKICSFFDLQPADAQAYLRHLGPRITTSVNQYKRSQVVRLFYRWLYETGSILASPFRYGSALRKQHLPRAIPSREGLRRVYQRLRRSESHVEQRDYAIIDVAYCCGLRLAELCRLNVSDVNEYDGALRVRGKFDKQRLVPIGRATLENLLHYIYHVRPKFLKDGPTNALFVTWVDGGERISRSGIIAMFRRLRKKYRFPKSLTAHPLRHAFATDLLRNGAPLQDVAKMLGHTSMQTTTIYTRLLPLDLRDHHRTYHPRG